MKSRFFEERVKNVKNVALRCSLDEKSDMVLQTLRSSAAGAIAWLGQELNLFHLTLATNILPIHRQLKQISNIEFR